MTSSLVGSEMCIRDSNSVVQQECCQQCSTFGIRILHFGSAALLQGAVSYTHLTLPTICSV
eukprot:6514360-Prorocentrum_lima.AAC.1